MQKLNGILDDFRKAKAEPDYDTSIGINYWYIAYFVFYFRNIPIFYLYGAFKLLPSLESARKKGLCLS